MFLSKRITNFSDVEFEIVNEDFFTFITTRFNRIRARYPSLTLEEAIEDARAWAERFYYEMAGVPMPRKDRARVDAHLKKLEAEVRGREG
jgi:hypothetical protein